MSNKIIAAGVIRPDPCWNLAAHCHSFHEVIVITEGRLLLNSDTDPVVAKAGDVLFYRAGFVHAEKSDLKKPVGSRYVAFARKDSLAWLPLLTHDSDGRVRQLVQWIADDERARYSCESSGLFLDAMLVELRRLCHSPTNPWLQDILDFIEVNLAGSLTLDDLARHGKMSKFAFVRKFKRLSGLTPMEQLRVVRLDQARNLLLTTNLPVKAIAPAVGISDVSQLSKLFRLHFKMTPRDVRIRGEASARG